MTMIWVPYANLALCAHTFDDRDLFEQQYNVMYLLQMMGNQHIVTADWRKHYDAWKPYPRALLHYLHTMILEWDRRDYPPLFDIIRTPAEAEENGIPEQALGNWYDSPEWLGWEELHSSHRAFMRDRTPEYNRRWDDIKKQLTVVSPGKRVPPGEYIVKNSGTSYEEVAMVIEHHRWNMEVLINGQFKRFHYAQVERRVWVPDYMPLHERYALVYPKSSDGLADKPRIVESGS